MAELISLTQFRALFPKAPIEFLDSFNKLFPNFGIMTVNKAAGFLSQCAQESACYTVFQENLNYSAEGLIKTFPKRFNSSNASGYARNPQAIANRVYGNRTDLGNGPESSGDGWKFRGRGLIQLTGRANYTSYAKYKGCSLDNVVSYLETFDGIVDSAFWFWKTRGCNKLAGDPVKLTKRVNGGDHGLNDRINMYNAARLILTNKPYSGRGFGGPISSKSASYLKGARASDGSYTTQTTATPSTGSPSNTPLAATTARDSDTTQGSRSKTGKRVRFTKNFYRDQFTCPSGCGADTVDANLIVVLQKFSNQLQNRPIKIVLGTICAEYGNVQCDQKMTHVVGKAVDLEVPKWDDKSFPAMKAIEVVKLLEKMFGDLVFCYAVTDSLVHLDTMNA